MDFEIFGDGYDICTKQKQYIICVDLKDEEFMNIELSKGLLSLELTEYELKEFYKHLKNIIREDELND